MKKRVIIIMTLLSLCLSLSGCSDYSAHTTGDSGMRGKRFVKIAPDVYYDSETGVEYFYAVSAYSVEFEVLYDVDGKPLIYEGGE